MANKKKKRLLEGRDIYSVPGLTSEIHSPSLLPRAKKKKAENIPFTQENREAMDRERERRIQKLEKRLKGRAI